MKNFRSWLSCAALTLAACASPAPRPTATPVAAESRVTETPAPWTEAFGGEAVLLAREVSIEGPPGLLAHFALQQDPRDFETTARATSKGFLQESRVSAELGASATCTWTPLRGQLDNLMIAASHRIRVLERPGPCDVVVTARGEAMWKCVSPADEKRGESLRLVGSLPE